jgi:hypothetical protein
VDAGKKRAGSHSWGKDTTLFTPTVPFSAETSNNLFL